MINFILTLATVVTVEIGTGRHAVDIEPAEVVRVTGEPMKGMQTKDAKAYPWTRQVTDPDPLHWGWVAGSRPLRYQAYECTARFSLLPQTLVVRKADGTRMEEGRDYELEPTWGAVARLEGGRIGKDETVLLDYSCRMRRVDLVYRDASGEVKVRRGESAPVMPVMPGLRFGESKIATVWIDPAESNVTEKSVFYVTEDAFPEKSYGAGEWPAERLLPKTLAKLRNGEKLRVLAWGDSVTEGSYLPEQDRWQHQFASRLRRAYPRATICLESRGWGGRSSGTFLSTNCAPAGVGHPFNYRERILGSDADLVVMEFVNDDGLPREEVFARYGKILNDLREVGKEWCIMTPHYTRGDWMGLASQQGIDEDPRLYVKSVREFCASNNVALADASLRWGRLYRQGIPYESLLVNTINHPNRQGMGYFADALMALFPPDETVASRTAKLRKRLLSQDRSYVFVALHQGDHFRAPGNSRESILGAIEMGADIVEVDVRETRDGRFVLQHDATLDRGTTGKGRIADFSREELRQVRLKRGGKPTEKPLVDLQELFDMTRGRILVNVDKFDAAPERIFDAIKSYGCLDEVIVKTALPPDRCRKLFGRYWPAVENGSILHMPMIQFCWGAANRQRAAEILPQWLALEPRVASMYEFCAERDADLIHLAALRKLSPQPRIWLNTMWDELCVDHGESPRGGNTPPSGWHGTDPEFVWGWALRQGVTMIQTDNGRELIAYLKRCGRR